MHQQKTATKMLMYAIIQTILYETSVTFCSIGKCTMLKCRYLKYYNGSFIVKRLRNIYKRLVTVLF